MGRNDFDKNEQIGATEPLSPGGFQDDSVYVTPSAGVGPTPMLETMSQKTEPIPSEDSSIIGGTSVVDPGVFGNIRPVVGWLVCVKGFMKGQDYRLHAGFNVVGRDRSCDVCIDDPAASRSGSFRIAYDSRGKVFYVTPERSANIAYHNDKPIFESQVLAALDTLSIGDTDLKFVPFCGENMTWEE